MRICIAICFLLCPTVFAQSKSPNAARGEIQLTYLGQAGYEITDGKTTVLVDPVISMIKLRRDTKPGGLDMARELSSILTPDTEAIDAKIKRADYILITHGHYDHALDAGYISNKTGAIIIGHETTANIARAYGVPHEKLLIVRGGEDFDFSAFSLKVIPSLHTAVAHKFYYSDPLASQLGGYAPKGLKAPLHAYDFAEGGDLMYLLRMAGHQVLIMGSMNYIEREVEGLRPDIAIVGALPNRHEIYDYTGRLMRALGHPATVFPTHWLYCGAPAWQDSMMKNAKEFADEVRAASPETHVIIPGCFEPITLPPRATRIEGGNNVKQAVTDAEHRWEEALRQFDPEAMQSLLDDDDLQTDFKGVVQDKTSWMQDFKQVTANVHSGKTQWEMAFDDEKVRVYGDVALVTGRGTFNGRRKGLPVNGVIRFTNVWTKRRGSWRLVSYQATPIESQ